MFPNPVGASPLWQDDASFEWVKRPQEDGVHGEAYTDGSFIDGPSLELGRFGWADAIYSDDGELIAAACGTAPWWVRSITAAEGWPCSWCLTF